MKTKILQAPQPLDVRECVVGSPSLFIGGGISGVANWQDDFCLRIAEAVKQIQSDSCLLLCNPRRSGDFAKTGSEAVKQIEWEFERLKFCCGHFYWFTSGSLCPITLYELGRSVDKDVTLFVGCDPEYGRKFDVETQVGLARPGFHVADSLDALVPAIVEWASRF